MGEKQNIRTPEEVLCEEISLLRTAVNELTKAVTGVVNELWKSR